MNDLLRSSKLFLKRNASTILTSIGGVGVVVASVMVAKETPKALALLEKAEQEKGESLTTLEKVKTAAPAYVPAAIVGVSTLACIVGANVLNTRQQASLMSAYALLDSSYKDYKNKVLELYGEDGNKQVKESLAQDKYEEEDITVSEDKILFYDEFSRRYFESTIEDVQRAEYHLNRDLSMRDYATVNEFYDYLGLPHIDGGDELGWSTGMNFDYYWQSWIDFGHHKTTMDDGLECFIITMYEEPGLGWEEY